jgi:hypothetical protein
MTMLKIKSKCLIIELLIVAVDHTRPFRVSMCNAARGEEGVRE